MILSIESSCDDSSIALTRVDTNELVFHKKISQELEHSVYGGVVPELASRLHAKALPKILEEIKEYFQEIKAIAVTNEPGLSVTLLEGVMMAKALSISLNKPLIAINHLKGHIYSLFIEKEVVLPQTVLLVSGGHTQIIEVSSYEKMEVVASTLDDSFGESFDKVAKMLGLGYPGGPVIEQMAKQGDENRFSLPIPLSNSKAIAFSYSGLKNAVRVLIEQLGDGITQEDKNDLCASFQKAATAHLLMKCKKYFKQQRPQNFAIVGGASANLYLRSKFEALLAEFNVQVHFAPLVFCSDNAAMIGRVGVEAYKCKDYTTVEEISVNAKVK